MKGNQVARGGMNWTTRRYQGAKNVHIVGDVGGDATAPPVILLHGGGQTRHSWGGAMRELVSRGYQVVNLDARGHGDSEWAADGDYSLDALVADLTAVIDTLASPPALARGEARPSPHSSWSMSYRASIRPAPPRYWHS
jgi:pimeloyl-ACP methyl ester carboxylesterase